MTQIKLRFTFNRAVSRDGIHFFVSEEIVFALSFYLSVCVCVFQRKDWFIHLCIFACLFPFR